MADLKACPDCGCEKISRRPVVKKGNALRYTVYCTNCQKQTGGIGRTLEKARKQAEDRWNNL